MIVVARELSDLATEQDSRAENRGHVVIGSETGNLLMTSKAEPMFNPKAFLAKVGKGKTHSDHPKNQKIFVQGDAAEAIYYVQKGKVKLTVVSKQGKEAVIAILGGGDFFGEGCLAGQPIRMSTVTTLSECSMVRIGRSDMVRVLHQEPAFSELFLHYRP